MNEIIEFKIPKDKEVKFPVKIGEVVWCSYYPDDEHDEINMMKVPVKVLTVYSNGEWNGEVCWGES